jgi:hypothetical protein
MELLVSSRAPNFFVSVRPTMLVKYYYKGINMSERIIQGSNADDWEEAFHAYKNSFPPSEHIHYDIHGIIHKDPKSMDQDEYNEYRRIRDKSKKRYAETPSSF